MKVLCIGHAAYDITIPLDAFPVENTKNRVPQRVECGGGPASNAAYLLGKWGVETYFAGVVGDDEYGRHIKKEFESVNVNIKYLELNQKYKTTSSFIIANKSNGSRTVLTYRPDEMKLTDMELDFDPDIILIDGQEPEFSKKVIEQFPKAITVIDAGRPKEEIIALAKLVKHVVCSKEFAEGVTGIKMDYAKPTSMINLFIEMKRKFNNTIIITLEDKGCMYQDHGQIKIMPSIQVKAVDSTGAGDIFHGAYVYGLAKKLNVERMLKMANIAGALSVTRIGGRNSVASLSEIEEVYNEHSYK